MRLLWSPSVVSSKLVRDALMQDEHIETRPLRRLPTGAGRHRFSDAELSGDQSSMLTINELDELRTLRAVGDVPFSLRCYDRR